MVNNGEQEEVNKRKWCGKGKSLTSITFWQGSHRNRMKKKRGRQNLGLHTFQESFTTLWATHRSDTKILYTCPRYTNDALERKETNTEYGPWEYYKCAVQNFFVSCGVDSTENYSEFAKRRLHSFYLTKPMPIMRCYCEYPLIMFMSRSERNPGRLFLKCPKRWCDDFQWVDQEPQGRSRTWLLDKNSIHNPMQDLFQLLVKSPVEIPLEGNWSWRKMY